MWSVNVGCGRVLRALSVSRDGAVVDDFVMPGRISGDEMAVGAIVS